MSQIKMFEYDPNNPDEWNALSAAQKWLKDNGYSYAPMCGPEPIGIMLGDFEIAKWRNLSTWERKELDGMIVPLNGGRFRGNSCTVKFSGKMF